MLVSPFERIAPQNFIVPVNFSVKLDRFAVFEELVVQTFKMIILANKINPRKDWKKFEPACRMPLTVTCIINIGIRRPR